MNIIKATLTVGLFTVLSRITGFLRDVVIAAYVDKRLCDIFIISTKLGNMLRKVFAEGAFHASFVPRFSDILHNRGPIEAQRVASEAFTFLFAIVCTICALVIIFYHYVLGLIAPSLQVGSSQYILGMNTGRLCFLFLIAASSSALFCGVLNAYNKFALAAAIQCIFNLTIMVAVLIGPLCFPNVAYTMSFGVVFAGIFQTTLLWIRVKKVAFTIKFKSNFFSPEIKDIFRHLLPGIISSGVWQINILIDMRMAMSLSTGTVTYIHFADRINQLPLSLIGIAMGTSLLVALSSSMNKQKIRLANAQFNLSVLVVTALTIPVLCSAFIMAPEVISIVFEHGQFNKYDVLITSQALMGFLSGMPAYVLNKIYSAVFFAAKDTKTPVKVGIISVISNIIVLYTLTPLFAHVGIALATSISSWVNVILLYLILYKRGVIKMYGSTWRKIFLQIVSATIMSTILYVLTIFIRKYDLNWFLLTFFTLSSIFLGFLIFTIIGHNIGGFNAKVFLTKTRRK